MITSLRFWRWVFVPISAVLAYLAAIPLALMFVHQPIHDHLWSTGHTMAGEAFIEYVLPFDGALAAALVVLAGAFTAPALRIRVALVLFLIGGLVAWKAVGNFHSYHRNGARLWWPIVGTYLGGLGAIGIVCLTSWQRPVQPTEQVT